MPTMHTAIVRDIPEDLRGRSWPPPTSDVLTPTCRAEEIPDLAAEGYTGPIHVVRASSHTPRRNAKGLPLLWRLEFCCVGGAS